MSTPPRTPNCQCMFEIKESLLVTMIISPRSQWEEYICPHCDELMDDPVLTSCGHRMCYKCFDERRRRSSFHDQWCPVRDNDGREHRMSLDDWSRDRTAEWKINGLLVNCEKCKAKCTVKEYRKLHRSPPKLVSLITDLEEYEMSHFLVNDHINTHWKELVLQDGVITSSELSAFCDSQFFTIILPSMKCKRRCTILKLIEECGCASCKCLFESLSNMFYMMSDSWSTTKADPYTKMASMETFRELEKFPPDQQQQLITQVLKEALPAAKDDLFIDEIRPLLYQNGVITSEEATELLGIFTGEEKVTRLYTKMLPSKGVKGLKKFMKILHDTGWKTPSHMLHHSVLSKILAEKLLQIKSNEAVLHQYENRRAAREAIVPTVYSESLPDAVVNLSKGVNKLLLLMVKKHIVSVTDYCWLRGAFYRGRKLEYLYNEVLPQKGVKGFKAFMEVLQDVGRKIPTYQNHRDQLKSSLQAQLLKL